MKKSGNLFYKTIQLIIAAFIGKGLGFIREMVLAYFYGASHVSDVYVAVQNIPAIIFTLFGTAVTTGFIPLYSEISVKKGKKEADRFANNVFNVFLVLAIILSFLGVIFSEQLVKIFAGGFNGETFILCNQFAKIIMPTSLAIILVYVYNAYLQIEGYFNQNSLMNVPYNIVQILFIAIGFYTENVYVLAIGLLTASYSQFTYLAILVKKKTSFKHQKILKVRDPAIKEMLILVGPVFISTGVNQLNTIVDRALASGLVEGSVSALNYSSEVANIVTQVIILSLTTILYPQMTRLFASDNREEQSNFTEKYINIVSLIVMPLTGLIFIFSKEIVQILFGRGAFDANTVEFVSKALKIYALGIVGASFRDVLNKVFYSMKNTVIPMVNGVIAVACNIGMNFALVGEYKYLGLATATALSSTICTILLFIQLVKKLDGLQLGEIGKEFLISVLGTGIMSVVVYGSLNLFKTSSDFLRCLIGGLIGILVYIIILAVVREKNIMNLLKKMKK